MTVLILRYRGLLVWVSNALDDEVAGRDHVSKPVRITIVYITGRREPHVDWMVGDLKRQMQVDDEIHLVVVDTFARPPAFLGIPGDLFANVVVTTPKPTIWQGPHRVTAVDWWANSNARNTGIALCKTDYIVFLDDRCHLGGGWLNVVRASELARESVVVGAYEKLENGKVTRDHRLLQCPEGKIDCGGGWLYGCTLALPLEWCLEANGFEEGCDGLSGEDYIFGFMLENNGHRIDYNSQMFVQLERSSLHSNTYVRTDKGKSPNDKSHVAIARFKPRKRTEFTPDLRSIRAGLSRGEPFPIPDPLADHRDWYDGTLVRNAVFPHPPG